MEIERLWGREPGWFMTQDQTMKARLIAWWNVRTKKPEATKRRAPARTPKSSTPADARTAAADAFWMGR